MVENWERQITEFWRWKLHENSWACKRFNDYGKYSSLYNKKPFEGLFVSKIVLKIVTLVGCFCQNILPSTMIKVRENNFDLSRNRREGKIFRLSQMERCKRLYERYEWKNIVSIKPILRPTDFNEFNWCLRKLNKALTNIINL